MWQESQGGAGCKKLPQAGKLGDNVSRRPRAWGWDKEAQRKPWERMKTEQSRYRQTDGWSRGHGKGEMQHRIGRILGAKKEWGGEEWRMTDT